MPTIHELTEEGSQHRVRALIKRDPSCVASRTVDGDQPLHLAAWQGHLAIVQLLRDSGAELSSRGDSGRTPLHYAAMHGHLDVARELVGAGADLNAEDDANFTPAFAAARSAEEGSDTVARYLVDTAGANVDLNLAVCLGDDERCRTLIQRGAPVKFPELLVHDAVTRIGAEVLERFGFEVDPANIERFIDSRTKTLRLLLQRGAPLDDQGCRTLFLAAQMPHPRVAQLLLEAGANPNRPELDLRSLTARSADRKALRAVFRKHGWVDE